MQVYYVQSVSGGIPIAVLANEDGARDLRDRLNHLERCKAYTAWETTLIYGQAPTFVPRKELK
jgi:hypothetical protein